MVRGGRGRGGGHTGGSRRRGRPSSTPTTRALPRRVRVQIVDAGDGSGGGGRVHPVRHRRVTHFRCKSSFFAFLFAIFVVLLFFAAAAAGRRSGSISRGATFLALDVNVLGGRRGGGRRPRRAVGRGRSRRAVGGGRSSFPRLFGTDLRLRLIEMARVVDAVMGFGSERRRGRVSISRRRARRRRASGDDDGGRRRRSSEFGRGRDVPIGRGMGAGRGGHSTEGGRGRAMRRRDMIG